VPVPPQIEAGGKTIDFGGLQRQPRVFPEYIFPNPPIFSGHRILRNFRLELPGRADD
jgi:hypothetical protein